MGMGRTGGTFENGKQAGRVESIQEVCRDTRANFTARFDTLEQKVDALGASVARLNASVGIVKAKVGVWASLFGMVAGAVCYGIVHWVTG